MRHARIRRLPALALGLCLTSLPAAVLGVAWLLNDAVRTQEIEADAARTAREVAGRVGALDTLMAALSGLRTDEAEDDGGVLIALGERLRAQVPFVTSLGRYRRIEPAARPGFVASMSERGLYDFRIRRIGADAADAPADASADVAYPISALEPMLPVNAGLLGADLGAVAGLAERLESAAARDASALVELPVGWPGRARARCSSTRPISARTPPSMRGCAPTSPTAANGR